MQRPKVLSIFLTILLYFDSSGDVVLFSNLKPIMGCRGGCTRFHEHDRSTKNATDSSQFGGVVDGQRRFRPRFMELNKARKVGLRLAEIS